MLTSCASSSPIPSPLPSERPASRAGSEPVLRESFSAGSARHRSMQFAAAPGIRNAIGNQLARITNLHSSAFICGLFFSKVPKISIASFIKLIFANFASSAVLPAPDPAPSEPKHSAIPSGRPSWRRPAGKSSEPVLRESFGAGRVRHRSIQFAAAPGIRNAIGNQLARITNLRSSAVCFLRMRRKLICISL